MAKTPTIEPGRIYRAADDLRYTWRVDKLLTDNVHVALICVEDATRRKTISIKALGNSRLFLPVDATRSRLVS
jgi:hypothetical protein